MKREIYLDSALFDEIDLVTKGTPTLIGGVTTNPSLIAKNQEFKEELQAAGIQGKFQKYCLFVKEAEKRVRKDRHLSVEVVSMDPREMVEQARELFKILTDRASARMYSIKVPVMPQYLKVIDHLSSKGLNVNATACATAMQGKMAYDCGANIISYFYNRMLDGKVDAAREISTCRTLVGESPTIICGSIRKPEDFLNCWSYGANVVTAPMKVIEACAVHEKTKEAVDGFSKDIEGWLS